MTKVESVGVHDAALSQLLYLLDLFALIAGVNGSVAHFSEFGNSAVWPIRRFVLQA